MPVASNAGTSRLVRGPGARCTQPLGFLGVSQHIEREGYRYRWSSFRQKASLP